MSNTGLASVEVVTSASVVLADAACVSIRVRVLFSSDPQRESVIQSTIVAFFMSNGRGVGTTLATLKSNYLNGVDHLRDVLKGLRNAQLAEIIDITVTSPPIPLFEEQAKDVYAILKSGESVRVTVASGEGAPRPLNTSELKKIFDLLSRSTFADLGQLTELIEKELQDPDRGWSFKVIGLEVVNCGCK